MDFGMTSPSVDKKEYVTSALSCHPAPRCGVQKVSQRGKQGHTARVPRGEAFADIPLVWVFPGYRVVARYDERHRVAARNAGGGRDGERKSRELGGEVRASRDVDL